jgi:methionyl aminopeptidase
MGRINIKSGDEVEKIKKACAIAGEALKKVGKRVKPGVSTEDLDKFAEKLIRDNGAFPVFLGYRGYKHATCMSVNEEIVHGIPGKRILQEGDVIKIDVGTKINGYCGDTAASFPVGKISKKAQKLLKTGKDSLKAAIKQARPGNHLGDVSAAVERVAKNGGYTVVRDLYGHGIGKELHEDPLVPNYGTPGEGPKLKPGMVFAIEPMLNIGGYKIRTLSDGWTVITADKSLSCHFEHTILITEGEPKVLTQVR